MERGPSAGPGRKQPARVMHRVARTGDQTHQTLRLEDGRLLGFAEYGNPSGTPVFYFHGSASSRLEHPTPLSLLSTAGIHFITVDRPGHGLSDFQAGRRLLDWPRDIARLADHLAINAFYVGGHSAGGPHALACAHQLPGRVLAGAAVSSVAPMQRPNAYAGMPPLNQVLARAARHIPWLTYWIRRAMRRLALADVEKSTRQLMASIPQADKDVLYEPANVDMLVRGIREGFRPGYQGVAQDDILINQEWGFNLAAIQPRIDIWHGEEDVNVPLHAAQYLSARLPHHRDMFLSGKGHFLS